MGLREKVFATVTLLCGRLTSSAHSGAVQLALLSRLPDRLDYTEQTGDTLISALFAFLIPKLYFEVRGGGIFQLSGRSKDLTGIA